MQADFWHDKWVKGLTGFHLIKVNPNLTEYWQALNLQGDETVLVPLCGKTLDMLWLVQQGHDVVGAELVEQAVKAFFTENQLQPAVTQLENHNQYSVPDLTVFCGDFFKLTKAKINSATVVYDRAALVALPQTMRKDYVAHIKTLMPEGSKVLLVTMEYDQSQLQGPPFSVVEDEVNALYEFATVTKLQQATTDLKGLEVLEKVYLIEF